MDTPITDVERIDCPDCDDDPEFRPECELCNASGVIEFQKKFAEELYYAAFDALRDLGELRRTLNRQKNGVERDLEAILKSCAGR